MDLPQPLAPTIPMYSPEEIDREKLRIVGGRFWEYRKVRFWKVMGEGVVGGEGEGEVGGWGGRVGELVQDW